MGLRQFLLGRTGRAEAVDDRRAFPVGSGRAPRPGRGGVDALRGVPVCESGLLQTLAEVGRHTVMEAGLAQIQGRGGLGIDPADRAGTAARGRSPIGRARHRGVRRAGTSPRSPRRPTAQQLRACPLIMVAHRETPRSPTEFLTAHCPAVKADPNLRLRPHRRGLRSDRPAGGQHCREALVQISDEIPGNLQRREMPPVSGDLRRTIFRYRSCAQGRGHFSMSRGTHSDC